MKQGRAFYLITTLLALALLNTACTAPDRKMVEKTPPYAVAQTLDKPKLFGEGIISTHLPEFATSFSPLGETVYFNVISEGRSVIKIVKSTFAEGGWSNPEPVAFSDGTHRDVDPFVTHDGARLYFSSNRPVNTGETKEDFDTWYVEMNEDGWSDPINPGSPLNDERSEVFVSTTESGTLYFSASEGDVRRIYRSSQINGEYGMPKMISLNIPDSVSVGNPMISKDGSFLVLTSSTLPGEGGSDLYISKQTRDGGWGEVTNLGKSVNSRFTDFAPGISPDGQYLFFTSERPGVVGAVKEGRPPGDLYQISIAEIMP